MVHIVCLFKFRFLGVYSAMYLGKEREGKRNRLGLGLGLLATVVLFYTIIIIALQPGFRQV